MAKATVAILRTKPETVIEDYRRLCEMAGLKNGLDSSATTILKDNITWHNVFPGVNTTPWQLEGTIEGLKESGFSDLVTVHNHTVVTLPEKGEKDLKMLMAGVKEKGQLRKKCHIGWAIFMFLWIVSMIITYII